MRLTEFISDRLIRRRRRRALAVARLVPDGIAVIEGDDGRTWTLAVEVDLGSERSRILVDKFAKYTQTFRSRAALCGYRPDLVVLLVPDVARARRLARECAHVAPCRRVLVGVLPSADPPKLPDVRWFDDLAAGTDTMPFALLTLFDRAGNAPTTWEEARGAERTESMADRTGAQHGVLR